MRRAFFTLAYLAATPVAAFDLGVPLGTQTASDSIIADSVRLPNAPWSLGEAVASVDGDIIRRAYRAPGGSLTTLQLMSPLSEALIAAGFEEVFACADAACGGFDFRFQLDLLGEPDMHVDLGDYRYFLAQRASGEPHTVAVVASRSSSAGFVHITEVYEASEATLEELDTPADPEPIGLPRVGGVLIDALVSDGRAVLEDLDFGSGSAELGEGPYASLSELAEWLRATPSARVALVGHTDAVGSLEANTALSLRRAETTAQRLIDQFGVASAQVDAHGAGYLAPRASNLSDTGRAANRRVEVVLVESGS